MKRAFFILAGILAVSGEMVFAQDITIINTSSCSGTPVVNVQAYNSSGCGSTFQFTANIANGSGNWGTYSPTDFNPPSGIAPVYWNLGATITNPPFTWDLAQIGYGSSGAAVGDPSFTCISGLSTTATITSGGCTIFVDWAQTPGGDVTLTLY